jgi:hypothetical protein
MTIPAGTHGPAGLRDRDRAAGFRTLAGAAEVRERDAEGLRERDAGPADLRERDDDAPRAPDPLEADRSVRREAPCCVDVVRPMSAMVPT